MTAVENDTSNKNNCSSLHNSTRSSVNVHRFVLESKNNEEIIDNIKKDVANAAQELMNHYRSNDYKLRYIDRLGKNLALYANKYRTNEEWMEETVVKVINDRAWINKHIINKSIAMAFNVYGYIVHQYFNGKECNADICPSMKNSFRDRTDEEAIAPGSTIDILDSIHVALLHGYDTGEKLYTSERNRLENMAERIQEDCTDLEAEVVRNMVGCRVERHHQRQLKFQSSRLSKFITDVGSINTNIPVTNDDENKNKPSIKDHNRNSNSNNKKVTFVESNTNNNSIFVDNEYFENENQNTNNNNSNRKRSISFSIDDNYNMEYEIPRSESYKIKLGNKLEIRGKNETLVVKSGHAKHRSSQICDLSLVDTYSDELMRISNLENIAENISELPKCEYDESEAECENLALYRFGYKFYYHQKYKNNEAIDEYYNGGTFSYAYWYICKKYESEKEELLRKISMRAYDNEMKSVLTYITSQYVRELKPKDEQCEDYETVDEDSTVLENHLLCLLIYCNLTKFSTFFSTTFRKIPESETNEELKDRNSEFREFSRLLVECVHCFGTIMVDCEIAHFYHGVSLIMQFPSTHGQFCSPTSTTTELSVAVHFGGEGIVLELANNRSDHMSFFDCSMFSAFSNEAEKLFIQGGYHSERSGSAYSAMPFKSVRNLKLVRNYEYYVIAISCFQQMIKGEGARKNTLELKPIHVNCLQKLITAKKSDSLIKFDSYIVQMFNSLIHETTNISIWTSFMNIHKHDHKNYYFHEMREIFCELYSEEELHNNRKKWGKKWRRKAKDGHPKGFIQPIFSFKFDLFFDLFPNLISIEIIQLPLTHQLMQYILNLEIWGNEQRRNGIQILIKEENEIYGTQSNFNYSECIEEYAQIFGEKGINIRNLDEDENEEDDYYEDEDEGIEFRFGILRNKQSS